jgi:hypothetical protein
MISSVKMAMVHENLRRSALEIKVHPNAVALFNIVLASQVGNESNTRFFR